MRLEVHLSAELDSQLEELARRTGQSKSELAARAIAEKLDDIEDIAIATERLATDGDDPIALQDIVAEFADDIAASRVEDRFRSPRAEGSPGPRKH